jgi:hypothetical protein
MMPSGGKRPASATKVVAATRSHGQRLTGSGERQTPVRCSCSRPVDVQRRAMRGG